MQEKTTFWINLLSVHLFERPHFLAFVLVIFLQRWSDCPNGSWNTDKPLSISHWHLRPPTSEDHIYDTTCQGGEDSTLSISWTVMLGGTWCMVVVHRITICRNYEICHLIWQLSKFEQISAKIRLGRQTLDWIGKIWYAIRRVIFCQKVLMPAWND